MNCFIIMPISTPDDMLKDYSDDAQHFTHILEHLFIPSVEACGLQPILPMVSGSEVIHGEIVRNLSSASLVLCDMSQLNPNVFFEFGIRTALNKPVSLVVDNRTAKIPFDTGIINYHLYESDLRPWMIKNEVERLSRHIQKTLDNGLDKNALWKYFGVMEKATFDPSQTTSEDKIDLILNKLDFMASEKEPSTSPLPVFSLDDNGEYPTYREASTSFRRDYLKKLLIKVAGNKREAAQVAGLSVSILYQMLKEMSEEEAS